MTATDSQGSADSPERAQLAAALAGRYVLRRELGRGGMATVYLADDLRHDRPVALKVLRPELASTLGPERFQREVRLAARLQHPHVLTVHDSGEAVGRLWFTMPYVAGESLRDRLVRERQLPVDDALRIAREAAQGLAYAHRHGVVHRDVKPENLLLTEDGTTLVADFGIARSLAPGGERLTATGLAVGTAAYMSPEQAAGESELDARSDVYSLGCVLYEMLAGEPPFSAPTAQAAIARRLTEPPRPLRQLRESVPEGVERAVHTALARTPADRFTTAADFARALATTSVLSPPIAPHHGPGAALIRRPLFATLMMGLVLGVGVVFAWRRSTEQPAAADAPRAIAVLPFENLGDSADAYFADGVTDAVRGKLIPLPGVVVRARSSSLTYRGTAKPPRQVAEELRVRYLLTGTVRWAKAPDGTSRVQVSPELVEIGPDGAPRSRWHEAFDDNLADVFRVQADIAGRVAEAMRVTLGRDDQARLARAPTANPEAYDAYLRGEAARHSLADGWVPSVRQAIRHYERAVALDPSFAGAWSSLARTAAVLYAADSLTPEFARRVKAAVDQAVALDPDGVEGHRALGAYYRNVEGDPVRALAEFRAAYDRAPGDATAAADVAGLLWETGDWNEALKHILAAYDLDPRSADLAGRVARSYLNHRRPAEARQPADRALALDPGNPNLVQIRAMVSLSEGDLAGARQVLRLATEVAPENLVAFMAVGEDLGWALDDDGQRLALTLGPQEFYDDRAVWAIVRAQLYAWRDDTAQSRIWADTAARHYLAQLRATPDDAMRYLLRGLALAYLGRRAEAIASGKRSFELNQRFQEYKVHQLARIYLLVGERELALEQLESLMKMQYYLTPAWLSIDPSFAPLRGNPRFEQLTGRR